MKQINVHDEVHAELKRLAGEAGLSMNRYLASLLTVNIASSGAGSVEREKAIINGDKQYRGTPCKHGHDGLRYTGTNVCVECHRIRGSMTNPLNEPMGTLIQRRQWLNQGHTKYHSNVPCTTCGDDLRWLKNSLCGKCFTGDGVWIGARSGQ